MARIIQMKRVLLTLGVIFWLFPSIGEAIDRIVDCDPPASQSVNEAIAAHTRRDTHTVVGTCTENVRIGRSKSGITLDGGGGINGAGGATINAADNSQNTIRIRARGVTIKGLILNGGGGTGSVINVTGGSRATIDSNSITNGRQGVFVNQNSNADIINSTISNNSSHGIFIQNNSYADMGFTGSPGARVAAANTITNNTGNGIFIRQSSAGRAYSNTISNNTDNGVRIDAVSYGRIASNTIENNGGDGISVTRNSSVRLGTDATGTDPVAENPNITNAGQENTGRGIKCRINSSVDNRRGTLTGDLGATSFSTDCADSTDP